MVKIFLMEDDPNLVQQAKQALTGRGYQFQLVDLLQAYVKSEQATVQYWQELGIKPEDLVILDLNFKQQGVNYSGLQVLDFIDTAKGQGKLLGLEKVLVATNMKAQLDSPDILLKDNVIIYGMEKTTNAKHEVNPMGYAANLCDKVNRIYRGQEEQLNK